ncbi:MAG TPA: pantetheine-phosphate adenylyltransferase [Gemmatimonadota bacterium]|nr:pantetheine-phosphate adenylyltransferase [Gemmatimonadota bacterium]
MSGTGGRLVGLYPGTFDPVTRGHEDLIERALRIVDELVVGIAVDTGKESLFPVEDRVAMLREVTAGEGRIRVETFSGLTVEFARSRNATVILRGLRAVSDFEYEFQMALMNKHLAEEIEIIFMAPDTTYSFLSSSLVREVARLGGDVTPFVSPSVARRLTERFGRSGT